MLLLYLDGDQGFDALLHNLCYQIIPEGERLFWIMFHVTTERISFYFLNTYLLLNTASLKSQYIVLCRTAHSMKHLQFQSDYAPVFQIQGDLEGFQIEKMKSEDLRHCRAASTEMNGER